MKLHPFIRFTTLLFCTLYSTYSLARTMVYISNADDGNIVAYELNADNGELSAKQTITAGDNVMPLVVSPNHKMLYASIRANPHAAVNFSINQSNGWLTKISQTRIQHDMCFIATDVDGEYLISSSYGGSSITVNAINTNGEVVMHGAKTYPTGLHDHAVLMDATNRFLFTTNIGSDQILQMVFNQETGEITPNTPAAIKTKTGAGPRHLRFSPDNKFVYLLNEYNGTVNVYAFNKNNGTLEEKQSISMSARGFKEKPSAAEIQITPNGQYVYTSERRTNTLSIFRRHKKTGLLTYAQSIPTEKKPRSFAITPNGRHLLSAGQESAHVSLYEISQDTGHLRFLQRYLVGNNPSWVEIVELK